MAAVAARVLRPSARPVALPVVATWAALRHLKRRRRHQQLPAAPSQLAWWWCRSGSLRTRVAPAPQAATEAAAKAPRRLEAPPAAARLWDPGTEATRPCLFRKRRKQAAARPRPSAVRKEWGCVRRVLAAQRHWLEQRPPLPGEVAEGRGDRRGELRKAARLIPPLEKQWGRGKQRPLCKQRPLRQRHQHRRRQRQRFLRCRRRHLLRR